MNRVVQIPSSLTKARYKVGPRADTSCKNEEGGTEPGEVVYSFESRQHVTYEGGAKDWRDDSETKVKELLRTELRRCEFGCRS